jgi:hypothetical protein
MKTLTAQASRASGQRWAELIYLLELKLWRDKYGPTPTSLTLYLSDRSRVEIGQEWLPLVVNWGSPGDALNPSNPEVTVGSFDVSLTNAYPVGGRARFSDLIRHGLNNDPATTYDILFAEATLRLLFRGGVVGDDLLLFRFLVEEARNVTADSLTLRMTGVELALEHGEDCYRVSTENFPLCDPDAVNQPVPIPFGRLTHQKTLGATSGLVDVLATDITAISPGAGGTLPLSDRAVVDRLPPSGMVQIDEEQIWYGAKNATAITLNNITRGYNGTTATDHRAGMTVFQVLSEYLYLVGENRGAHRIQSIPAVRSDGMLLAPSSYTVDLANTTLLSGRNFAVVRFPVKPIISKQVTYQVQDTITVVDTISVSDTTGVLDNIGVSDGLGVSDNITITPQGTVTQSYNTLNTIPSGNIPQGPPGVTHSFPGLAGGGAVQYVRFTLTTQNSNTVTAATFPIELYGPNDNWHQFFSGLGPVPPGGSVTISWTVNGNVYGNPRLFTQSGILMRVLSFQQDVVRNQTTTKSGSAYRSGGVGKTGSTSKTGTVTKVGQSTKSGTVKLVGNSSADTVLGEITADVNGLQDDASGTISGTANTFLEVPHDVLKCLLREVWQEKDSALYHAATWTATRQEQVTAGYRWAVMAVPLSFAEFRRTAGFQGRAELYQEGGQWAYKWRAVTPALVTFNERNLADEIVIDWSPRTELVTELDVGYDEAADRVGHWQQSLTLRSDLTQYRYRYGLQRTRRDLKGRTLELPWVRETAMATRLGTYWLSQWERERLRPKIRGFWDVIGLDKTDTIQLEIPLLTAYGAMQFTVRRKVYELDDGLLSLECEETDAPPQGDELLAAYRIPLTSSHAMAALARVYLVGDRAMTASLYIRQPRTQTVPVLFALGGPQSAAQPAHYRVHQRAVDGASASARYGVQWVWAPTKTALVRLKMVPSRTLSATLVILAGGAVSLQIPALYRSLSLQTRTISGVYRFASLHGPTLMAGYEFVPRLILPATYAIRPLWDAPGIAWDTAGLVWDIAAGTVYTMSLPLAGAYRFAAVARSQMLMAGYAFIPRKTLTATYVMRPSTWDASGTHWDTAGLIWDP